jgi:hypothetical protein
MTYPCADYRDAHRGSTIRSGGHGVGGLNILFLPRFSVDEGRTALVPTRMIPGKRIQWLCGVDVVLAACKAMMNSGTRTRFALSPPIPTLPVSKHDDKISPLALRSSQRKLYRSRLAVSPDQLWFSRAAPPRLCPLELSVCQTVPEVGGMPRYRRDFDTAQLHVTSTKLPSIEGPR